MSNKKFNTIDDAIMWMKNRAKELGYNIDDIKTERLKVNDGAWIAISDRNHKYTHCFTVLPHSESDKRYSITIGKCSC